MPSSIRAFNIRPAKLTDLDSLCEFADEFLNKMHAKATGKDARHVFQRVIKDSEIGLLLVAEHKAGVCAYVYASYEWRSEFGGETLDLVELFVEQAWRNKGVAASLIKAVVEKAKQRGIRRISAEVHAGNAVIERMLDSSGFDPEHRTVWGLQL
jgi:GNAT superfamily N-acetyltransferase